MLRFNVNSAAPVSGSFILAAGAFLFIATPGDDRQHQRHTRFLSCAGIPSELSCFLPGVSKVLAPEIVVPAFDCTEEDRGPNSRFAA